MFPFLLLLLLHQVIFRRNHGKPVLDLTYLLNTTMQEKSHSLRRDAARTAAKGGGIRTEEPTCVRHGYGTWIIHDH
jgi:hypothetical protein